MFDSVRSNVISVVCSKDFRLGWGNELWLKRRVYVVGEISPKLSVVKWPDIKKNTGIC